MCCPPNTQENKHVLLVNRLVLPGLTAFSKSLCANSLYAFLLPEQQLSLTSLALFWRASQAKILPSQKGALDMADELMLTLIEHIKYYPNINVCNLDSEMKTI